MKVIVTAVGILIYGQLSEESEKMNVFHVKFEDIKAVELDAYKEGGELTFWLSEQDTTVQYRIFDDITYNNVQEALIRIWGNR